MGFFSDLKQDLSQAVNELMPAEKTGDEEVQTEERTPADTVEEVSLEEMLQNIDSIELPEELQQDEGLLNMPETQKADEEEGQEKLNENAFSPVQDNFEPMPEISNREQETPGLMPEIPDREQETPEAEQKIPDLEQELVAAFGAAEDEETAENYMEDLKDFLERKEDEEGQNNSQMPENQTGAVENKAEENNGKKVKTEDRKEEDNKMDGFGTRQVSDETAVITAGMTVTGDIASEGSIDVIGSISGNIDVKGKLNVTGYINGNSKAAEIYAEGAKINGEVVSEGAVKIGASSVIIGNITAFSAAIAGAVKGDIDVQGPVILDASAIVMGNIKSKSVQINNGAVIEGMCSQCYADVSPTSFFSEYKMEKKPAQAEKKPAHTGK